MLALFLRFLRIVVSRTYCIFVLFFFVLSAQCSQLLWTIYFDCSFSVFQRLFISPRIGEDLKNWSWHPLFIRSGHYSLICCLSPQFIGYYNNARINRRLLVRVQYSHHVVRFLYKYRKPRDFIGQFTITVRDFLTQELLYS